MSSPDQIAVSPDSGQTCRGESRRQPGVAVLTERARRRPGRSPRSGASLSLFIPDDRNRQWLHAASRLRSGQSGEYAGPPCRSSSRRSRSRRASRVRQRLLASLQQLIGPARVPAPCRQTADDPSLRGDALPRPRDILPGQHQGAREVKAIELAHHRLQPGQAERLGQARHAAQWRAVEQVMVPAAHHRERHVRGGELAGQRNGAAVQQHRVEQRQVGPLAAQEAAASAPEPTGPSTVQPRRRSDRSRSRARIASSSTRRTLQPASIALGSNSRVPVSGVRPPDRNGEPALSHLRVPRAIASGSPPDLVLQGDGRRRSHHRLGGL